MTLPTLCYSLFFCLLCVNASAEVTTDGSVGARVALTGPHYSIDAELGHQVGSNLFHSFARFNLDAQEQATFHGADDISNVISRVTEGRSLINGTVRSAINGADFYFINPAGIVFGPHAHINVNGSFYASTADRLKFNDGNHFSATNPQQSQFTTALPEAFGFLDNHIADIHKEPAASAAHLFITVPEGETITLVGGNLTFTEAPPNAEAESNLAPTLSARQRQVISQPPLQTTTPW